MKAILLALGLLMAGNLYAASTTGSIGVKLTIYTRCQVDGSGNAGPSVDCGKQAAAQPRITRSLLPADTQRTITGRLVTIEW